MVNEVRRGMKKVHKFFFLSKHLGWGHPVKLIGRKFKTDGKWHVVLAHGMLTSEIHYQKSWWWPLTLMALKREDRLMEKRTPPLEKSVLPLDFVQHAFNYQMPEKIVLIYCIFCWRLWWEWSLMGLIPIQKGFNLCVLILTTFARWHPFTFQSSNLSDIFAISHKILVNLCSWAKQLY